MEWNGECQYNSLFEWVGIYRDLLQIMILDADDPMISKDDVLQSIYQIQYKVHEIVVSMELPKRA